MRRGLDKIAKYMLPLYAGLQILGMEGCATVGSIHGDIKYTISNSNVDRHDAAKKLGVNPRNVRYIDGYCTSIFEYPHIMQIAGMISGDIHTITTDKGMIFKGEYPINKSYINKALEMLDENGDCIITREEVRNFLKRFYRDYGHIKN